jgi:hypothetical protein
MSLEFGVLDRVALTLPHHELLSAVRKSLANFSYNSSAPPDFRSLFSFLVHTFSECDDLNLLQSLLETLSSIAGYKLGICIADIFTQVTPMTFRLFVSGFVPHVKVSSTISSSASRIRISGTGSSHSSRFLASATGGALRPPSVPVRQIPKIADDDEKHIPQTQLARRLHPPLLKRSFSSYSRVDQKRTFLSSFSRNRSDPT